MQFYYGEKMSLRLLDEAEFWKHQEAEHTEVIRELAKGLEARFVDALKQWEQALSRTQAEVRRYIETYIRAAGHVTPAFHHQVLELIRFCLHQSHQFIGLLNQIGSESAAIRNNPTALVVLNHIRRESEYFIGIAQTILYQPGPLR